MDSITQAVFGGAIGQAVCQNKLGRRAIVFGALGGTIPDLDVLWQFGDEFSRWEVHRGFSHSVFFAPLLAPFLGWGMNTWYKRQGQKTGDDHLQSLGSQQSLSAWILLFAVSIFTHPFLDLLTPYGTQMLQPLSDHRFAIHAMSIIDPVYTGALLLAVIFGMSIEQPTKRPMAAAIAGYAIVLSIGYQLFAASEMQKAQLDARAQLAAQNIRVEQVDAYPTLLQPFFRRIVVRMGDSAKVGAYSTLAPSTIEWFDLKGTHGVYVDMIANTREGKIFNWFTSDNTLWQRLDQEDGGFIIRGEDLRYGSMEKDTAGFWGIEAKFDAQGNRVGPVYRTSNRPLEIGQLWDDLWLGTFVPD
jgi:inner membrane protein